jgi:hypothetical protein
MAERVRRVPWWVPPSGRIHPAWWLIVLPILIWVDYVGGPESPFPFVYVLPVCFAAWYSGQGIAVALAVIMPLVHVGFLLTLWRPPFGLSELLVSTSLRLVVVSLIALVFARQSEYERAVREELERRHALELQREQLRVVHVTMRTVHDIFNNCLNQLQLLRMDAEGRVPNESLELFDAAIREAALRLKALADMPAFAETPMAIGPGLDEGKRSG